MVVVALEDVKHFGWPGFTLQQAATAGFAASKTVWDTAYIPARVFLRWPNR